MTLKVVRSSDTQRDTEISKPSQVASAVKSEIQAATEQVKSTSGVVQRLTAEAVVVTGRAKTESTERIRDTKDAKAVADDVAGRIRKNGGQAKGAHGGLTSTAGRSHVE